MRDRWDRVIELPSIRPLGAVADDLDDEALWLEPREIYDAAALGSICCGSTRVVLYSAERCIKAIEMAGCDDDGAVDWFQMNTSGAWSGEYTPCFLWIETA